MTQAEFIRQNKLTEYELRRCIEMLKGHYSTSAINLKTKLNHRLIESIKHEFIRPMQFHSRVKAMSNEPVQYWQNEDEMQIQDYKVEDLKGDELLILNELK